MEINVVEIIVTYKPLLRFGMKKDVEIRILFFA